MKKLNFGAGLALEDTKLGWDNADFFPPSNLVFDFDVFPYPIKDNTYDYVYSRHVLEHLRFPEKTLNELHRICKPNAIIEINVPHFNNEGSFTMLGHISYFTATSFRCLTDLGDAWRQDKKQWEIVECVETPSWIGKFIFIPIVRRKLSVIIRGLYNEVHVKLRVIK